MTWVLLVAVMLPGTIIGARWLMRHAPASPDARIADPDAALDADARAIAPSWASTTAVVTGLHQSGMSRGLVRHRCSLELLVTSPTKGADPVGSTIEVDVDLSSLTYVLAGSTVDVLADPLDPSRCFLLPGATRARATGHTQLPPVRCGGIPDAVLIRSEERVIADPIRRTAVLSCVDVLSPEYGLRCNATFGFWVGDDAEVGGGRGVVVSDRVTALDLIALPRGATVDVAIDPEDPRKVVVDLPAARAALAARLPSANAMRRAREELGFTGEVMVVQSLVSTGGSFGVRQGARATFCAVDHAGVLHGEPRTEDLMAALPELAAVVPGSVVVVGEGSEGRTRIDLDATARARVHCATAT